MDHEPARTYRLTQFSLLNLVLMTTVVALGVTVYLLYQEVAPLRAEVKRLRDEVGELHVEDKSKVHAIRVETDNELEWKWRIWVPVGAIYNLRGFGDEIPNDGFPDTGGTIYLREPGEHVVRWVIKRDPKNGRWAGSLHQGGSSAGSDTQPWVEWPARSGAISGVGTSTRVFEPHEQVELARHRYENKNNPPAKPTDPLPGFMIWLEPQ